MKQPSERAFGQILCCFFSFTINTIKEKVQERTIFAAICLPILGLHKLELSPLFGELLYWAQYHKTKETQGTVVWRGGVSWMVVPKLLDWLAGIPLYTSM